MVGLHENYNRYKYVINRHFVYYNIIFSYSIFVIIIIYMKFLIKISELFGSLYFEIAILNLVSPNLFFYIFIFEDYYSMWWKR
ncbi:hypothetical protein PNEG_04327 [Pneumocystis murina B123]|uniref:Uncharacterized protein n=1 Tax=Pneumocystis murina (strain B123) TaxID=1069680 RepID=A0A0W4ZWW6_PNEMU|nr:hypothetical protein PNEG_04327 [Pneumocystis murina B123]KTW32867.1 hypothetical protein PNEG_04327 [Pneumocystis murina B123]